MTRFTPKLSSLVEWTEVKEYEDITFHIGGGIARIAFNRPEIRNAFRPKTIDEMTEAVLSAWHRPECSTKRGVVSTLVDTR